MSPNVSLSQYPPVQCVRCGARFQAELYVIVDIAERPDLAQRIRDDIIHCWPCPQCATVMAFGMPLLVYRPGTSVPVMISPVPEATEAQQEEHADMLMHHFRERMGAAWDDQLAKGVYRAERSKLHYLIDCNPDLLPGGRDPTLREAMTEFLIGTTWEEARAAVEQHPVLLSREAEIVLRTNIDRAAAMGHRRDHSTFSRHLDVLLRSRSEGVAAAFAPGTGAAGFKWR